MSLASAVGTVLSTIATATILAVSAGAPAALGDPASARRGPVGPHAAPQVLPVVPPWAPLAAPQVLPVVPHAAPLAAPHAAPTVAPSSAPVSVEPAPDSRTGGSDPTPGTGKPGWVWWVAIAFLAILGAGGLRLWRSMRL